MFKQYWTQYKVWYESRELREQILVMFLTCAVVYAIFSLLIIDPTNKNIAKQEKALDKAVLDKQQWAAQLGALKKIDKTPIYSKWKKQQEDSKKLKETYKDILKKPIDKSWEEVITAILNNQSNIILDNITSQPERLYQKSDSSLSSNNIYEQNFSVSMLSNYFDTLAYLKHLENDLPNLHWDELTYEVKKYPVARVQLEFSIVYEKTQNTAKKSS